jgi:TRAP-type uncharacterized transport system substrate-binding protein
MRVLPLDEPILIKLEALGLRRALIPKSRYPKLLDDVPTLDFSGFAVYTHANVPDAVITSVCAALEARKEKIGSAGKSPVRCRSIGCAAIHPTVRW